MANLTISPVSVSLSGAEITKESFAGKSNIKITPTTAQSSLNFEDLFIVIENSGTSSACTVTVKAGDDYSEVGIGDAPSVTIASATTAGATIKVIGGKELESARFKNKNGYLNLNITTAATCYVYAIMQPFTILNPK